MAPGPAMYGGPLMATPIAAPAPIKAPPPAPAQAIAPQRTPMGSSVSCPRCNTATPVGFAYCQQCGLHMQAIAPTDPGAARARSPSAAPPIKPNIDPQGVTLAAPDARAPVPAPVGSTGQWGTAVLVNRDGTDGQRFALTADDTVVGRAGAEIAFEDDRFLAKQHARFERSAEGVRVHAIDTLNGVFRKADAPVELVDGAIVLVGREVLRFERVAAEERTMTPLVRHGIALFGSPPREPWGRLFQLIPSGGYRDVRHLIGEEIVLGREEGDIVFRDDAFMSRRHAALNWDGKAVKLTDLGSSNGSFVRITGPTVLKNGDHVRMGDQLLRIELR
ncbi:MAG: domain containing protein [Myxococcales bacterium]|nr:domain containing protein [Myxococcales bacterium]